MWKELRREGSAEDSTDLSNADFYCFGRCGLVVAWTEGRRGESREGRKQREKKGSDGEEMRHLHLLDLQHRTVTVVVMSVILTLIRVASPPQKDALQNAVSRHSVAQSAI